MLILLIYMKIRNVYFNPYISGMRPGFFIPAYISSALQPTHPCEMRYSRRCGTSWLLFFRPPGLQPTHPSGCDDATVFPYCWSQSFNPRIPHGMQLPLMFWNRKFDVLQFTHPLRDATAYARKGNVEAHASTHASLRDATSI